MGKVAPLLVLVGQTASGKSALAMEIAQRYNGEIICADSRTVYRGMDISTAKPSRADQKTVAHHLLDLVDPDQDFSVADFKQAAITAIEEISARCKLPILVGGSGLYVDSVIYDYQFRQSSSNAEILAADMSIEEMQQVIADMGLELPENAKNRRYLGRIIESGQNSPRNRQLRENTLVIGLSLEPELLVSRIRDRTKGMVEDGLVDEIRKLTSKYGWECSAFRTPAISGFQDHILHDGDIDKAIELVVGLDIKLAKKQMTWFKRNKSIHWLDDPSKYIDSTTKLLNNFIRES